MLKFLRRNEPGLQTIGVCWHEAAWARKALELRWWTPAPNKDPKEPFRFVLELVWGPGAGYINGGALFFGLNCKDRRPNGNIHKRTLVQCGLLYCTEKKSYQLTTGRIPYVY